MGSDAVIDLRSDTVTRPTEGMRDAMMAAPLGDDVFGDDPTVNALEAYAASMLGKEAALYVPSGTMANQLAIRAQTQSGDEVIAHAKCHIVNYESAAAAALAGVQLRTISSDHGGLPMDALKHNIHQTDDPHYANTTLVCMENTHNGCGGVVLDQAQVDDVTTYVHDRGIRLHMDGARLFNAAMASAQPVDQLVSGFDTVSCCLSKGLGAPVGSILAGDRETIKRAHRFRKMYGGGMRQAGVIAAAGLYALKHHVAGLRDDHARAKRLAEAFSTMAPLAVDLSKVQSNLIYFDIDADHPLAALESSGAPLLVRRLEEAGVLITGSTYRLRAVTHLDVNDDDIERTIESFRAVLAAA
jgi:threonine aldolase